MLRLGYVSAVSVIAGCAAIGGMSQVHAACDEVGYVATFEVKPGSEEAFEQAVVAVANKVDEVEDGVLLYAPYRGDNGSYYMMERYKNLAAREAHAKAPEVLELFPPLMETLSAPIGVEAVTAVCGAAE